jgi:hypothetical protein
MQPNSFHFLLNYGNINANQDGNVATSAEQWQGVTLGCAVKPTLNLQTAVVHQTQIWV